MTTERFILPLVQRRSVQQILQPRVKTDHLLLFFPSHIPIHGITQHPVSLIHHFRLRGMKEGCQNNQDERNKRRISCRL
jgi:hypothetical protein